MELGIDNLKDFLEVLSFIATIIGGIAIVAAVRSYSVSQKQLNFSALESCIRRFREDFSDLSESSPEEQSLDYLEFINEELFYFEHGYLPFHIADDWLERMLSFLPVYGPDGNIVLQPIYSLPGLEEHKWLDKYSFRRVRKVFTLKDPSKVGSLKNAAELKNHLHIRDDLMRALTLNVKTLDSSPWLP
ncbi:MAG: hypothetical protein AAFR61_18040 [Bacteroidota bacterium]